MQKPKFGIGEYVTATIMGTKEKRDEKGNVLFSRDDQNREIPQLEPVQLRATFSGQVLGIHGRLEGDGSAFFTYDVECPHKDRAESMWVEEKHLVAAIPPASK